jgi:lipid II:glycine glycyltransferase (peptidoglycan interpeptide bridge formation enzyme)
MGGNMELFYFKKKEELDDFIISRAGVAGAEFLQSWNWGEIMAREGAEVLRIGVRHLGNILAAATLVKKFLPLFGLKKFYWYVPRGPIGDKEALAFLFAGIKKKYPAAVFLRFEPEAAIMPNVPIVADGNLSSARRTRDYNPAKTLILDLKKDETKLLDEMSQKTRYNIRLAEKKGVEIRFGSAADWPEFRRLLRLTGARDGFRLHGEKHYQSLIADSVKADSAENNDGIKLFFARYQGKNIAVGLFSFWGGRGSYLHGASDNEYRNVMAPHLLQWAAIKAARASGCTAYDFCGIDEKKWPGVTRFKRGFGGKVLEFPGTFDFIFRPFDYRVYGLLRKIRSFIK